MAKKQTTPAQDLTRALADADAALRASERALRDGNFTAYGKAQDDLQDAINRAIDAQRASRVPTRATRSSPCRRPHPRLRISGPDAPLDAGTPAPGQPPRRRLTSARRLGVRCRARVVAHVRGRQARRSANGRTAVASGLEVQFQRLPHPVAVGVRYGRWIWVKALEEERPRNSNVCADLQRLFRGVRDHLAGQFARQRVRSSTGPEP